MPPSTFLSYPSCPGTSRSNFWKASGFNGLRIPEHSAVLLRKVWSMHRQQRIVFDDEGLAHSDRSIRNKAPAAKRQGAA